MDPSPVSIVLVFRNHPERAEQTLQVLLPYAAVFREIIVFDDGSDDLTPETIDSLIAAFNPENIQFFRNLEPAGKGVCINQALPAITAPVLWLPSGLLDFDGGSFLETVRNIERQPVACSEMAAAVTDFGNIAALLTHGKVPPDSCFLFSTGEIAARDAFANPFLDEGVATEWAARISVRQPAGRFLNEAFFMPDAGPLAAVSAFSVRQIAWSLYSVSGSPALAALTGLSETVAQEIPAQPDITGRNIAARVQALINQGNVDDAAWLMQLLEDDDPLRAELEPLFFQNEREKDPFFDPQPDNEPDSGPEELQYDPQDEDPESPGDEEPVSDEEEPELSSLPEEQMQESGTLTSLPRPAQISLFDAPAAPDADAGFDSTEKPWKPRVSLVIATTIDGQKLLENGLLSLEKHESADEIELIVVDNASLDDTHDYLEQLAESGFFNLTVITNPVNRGVAASWNQGLSAAKADIVCFFHNDAEFCAPVLTDLASALETEPDFGVVSVPAISFTAPQPAHDSEWLLQETSTPGSVCFAIRKSDGFRFDEQFAPAWFEDADLFMQMVRAGFLLGKLENRAVSHEPGTSTRELGFYAEGETYFTNKARFNVKWGLVPVVPDHLSEASAINRLLAISDLINPFFPEPHFTEEIDRLLTPEVRTDLTGSYWDRENLFGFIKVLALTDHRDLLRLLEEKAAAYRLYPELQMLLVSFYAGRKIFSRCEHYLDLLEDDAFLARALLVRTAIFLEDHKLSEAVASCNRLAEIAPVNADYFDIAARLNDAFGEKEQAETFRLWARQMHPQKYNGNRFFV